MYGKRLVRGLTPDEWEHHREAEERARKARWNAKGVVRVSHPAHGTVVVPHSSNYAAILNAAEVWGCDWVTILDAEVWRAEPGEKPVPMPIHIK